tara:strand:+ start:8675 stop:9556 length:882 start_codon:yes stop_codon:yes gene_type:complete
LKKRKGIILAGGAGTRLHPLTNVISKQLLPISDKPMIYYPLSVLMMARIKDILIISTPNDLPLFKKLFNDGSHLGLNITYEIQEKPKGIAEAFLIGESFIGNDQVVLILGDNIFYGYDLRDFFKRQTKSLKSGATIFGYEVSDPDRFGIVEVDEKGKALSLEEKPSKPKSNLAVVGLYIYDNRVVELTKKLKPSLRGELEITDLNKVYLKNKKLNVVKLRGGFAWLDTGTHSSLLEAGHFVNTIEKRQGIKIGCIEEIAYTNGWISKRNLLKMAQTYKNNQYGKYLKKIAKEK